MSREQVVSEAPGGGSDRFYLDQFGQVTSLVLDWNYPGGQDTATWNLAADEHFSHRALAPGRFIAAYSGGLQVWRGRMQEPTRGVPWTCTATGIGQAAADFTAIATASKGGGLALNQVVDNAINRGLPWSRIDTLPFASGLNFTSGQQTVADVLNAAAQALGVYWTLDYFGHVSMNTPPNGVQYTVMSQSDPGGRSTDGYATAVAVQWVSANTKNTVTSITTNPDAVRAFGTIEAPLDLSSFGSMNDATQAAAGLAYLNLRSPRTFFSGQLTLTDGQVCNFGGQPVDLASVTPGQRMRIHWTDVDPFGEINPTTPLDIMIGHTSYDSDAGTLTITPLDATQRTIDEGAMVHRSPAYREMRARQRHAAGVAKKKAAAHAAYLKWYKRTHHGHLPPKPAPPRKKKK